MTNFLTEGVFSRYWRLAYIGFGLLTAILYDVFFWNLELGLGFLVFVLIYVIGFIILTVLTKQFREPKALLLLIPVLIMSADVVLYNNRLVTEAVPWFVFILLFLFSILLTLQNPNKYKFSFSHIPVLMNIELTFLKWSVMWKDLFHWEVEGKKQVYKKILIGVGISIPILLVFGSLFSAADFVFADILRKFFDFDIEDTTIWRVFRTFLITLFTSSIFYVLISRNNILGHKVKKVMKLDNTIIGTILVLVNVLFLVFVLIQFRYLFGGVEYIFEREVSFADYARNGFFQLVWVIGLAALMLVFFYRSAAHHGSGIFLKLLKVMLIAQVGIIAVSALHRMNLYQGEFGYTVLRLYVEWFIYFSLIILAFAGVSLLVKLPFRLFLYTSMILGVIALTSVSSVNVDRMIAKENIDRHLVDEKELDIAYLEELSVDILPELDILVDKERLADMSKNMMVSLGSLAVNVGEYVELYDSWREIHIGVAKAKKTNFWSGEHVSSTLKAAWTTEQGFNAFLGQLDRSQVSYCRIKGVAGRSTGSNLDTNNQKCISTQIVNGGAGDSVVMVLGRHYRDGGENYDLIIDIWERNVEGCSSGYCYMGNVWFGSTDDGKDNRVVSLTFDGTVVEYDRIERTYGAYKLKRNFDVSLSSILEHKENRYELVSHEFKYNRK